MAPVKKLSNTRYVHAAKALVKCFRSKCVEREPDLSEIEQVSLRLCSSSQEMLAVACFSGDARSLSHKQQLV